MISSNQWVIYNFLRPHISSDALPYMILSFFDLLCRFVDSMEYLTCGCALFLFPEILLYLIYVFCWNSQFFLTCLQQPGFREEEFLIKRIVPRAGDLVEVIHFLILTMCYNSYISGVNSSIFHLKPPCLDKKMR